MQNSASETRLPHSNLATKGRVTIDDEIPDTASVRRASTPNLGHRITNDVQEDALIFDSSEADSRAMLAERQAITGHYTTNSRGLPTPRSQSCDSLPVAPAGEMPLQSPPRFDPCRSETILLRPRFPAQRASDGSKTK